MNQQAILQQQVEIVLAQLKAASPTLKFYIGGDSAGGQKMYTKKEMIEHVTALDDVGKQFLQTQIDFMKALKNGDFQKVLMA